MSIVTCRCGARFQAAAHVVGMQVPCPTCGRLIQIPKPGAAPTSKSVARPFPVKLVVGIGLSVVLVVVLLASATLAWRIVGRLMVDARQPGTMRGANRRSPLARTQRPADPARPRIEDKPDQGTPPSPDPGDTVRPSASAPVVKSTDVIAALKQLDTATSKGSWIIAEQGLTSPGTEQTAYVTFPIDVPRNYQLSLTVEVLSGEGSFNAAIVVDGHPVMVVLDGWGHPRSGLNMINGRTGDNNETTHRGRVLTPGTNQVDITVQGRRVAVRVNDNLVIEWSGNPNQLRLDTRFWPNIGSHIFVASWNTSYRISRAHLTPLIQ